MRLAGRAQEALGKENAVTSCAIYGNIPLALSLRLPIPTVPIGRHANRA